MSDKPIRIKKEFGQHFLRDFNVVESMIQKVGLDQSTSVFEIGCGDGFLTQRILQEKIARLQVFEIDAEWANYVREKLGKDDRLTISEQNILDLDFSVMQKNAPWTLLANLPYNITFPILHLLQKNRHLLKEGVVMIQEEVAQKIVKKGGRGFGYVSLFFQHYFQLELLLKVPPSVFVPPPKVFSRLLYFKPKQVTQTIVQEPEFWRFIKMCFVQPRRTLRNNLQQTHFDISKIDEKLLKLRSQQMSMQDFLNIWNVVR